MCKNGVRIVLENILIVWFVVIGVWIGMGFWSEYFEINGVLYFFEYMFFKGIKIRFVCEIVESFDCIGG